ncbi:MAG: aromatic amino acid lyase, partial [Chitinophagaceae bacterium]
MLSNSFFYGSQQLTVQSALLLAAGRLRGVLDEAATRRVRQSQEQVQAIVAEGRTVYGINTGFGILADTPISEADTRLLQHKILQSHSVGVGDPIPAEIAKLMLITKVQALVQGYSGVQLETLERIIWHIDNDVIPVVPEKGSVGASGDLAPLAHLFLPLIGLGEVYFEGTRRPAGDVLR